MLFINGADLVIKDYGYWPSFHDDNLDSIKINGNSIEFIIDTIKKPKGKDNYKVKFVFENVDFFELTGGLYGICSIILDLKFTIDGDLIDTVLYSSMGTTGRIKARKVSTYILE